MKASTVLTWFFLILLALALLVLIPPLIPEPNPYDAYNIYWNGYSAAISYCNATVSYGNIQNASTVILIPMIKPTQYFVSQLMNFTRSGGTLVILDNGQYFGNYILSVMNVSARFSGYIVIDPILDYVNEHLPIALISSKFINVIGTQYVLLDNSSYILLLGSGDYTVIAKTSIFSVSGNNSGPFPVVVLIPYGNGSIILISDPAIFMNSIINKYGNSNLLHWICGKGRTVFLENFIAKVTPLSVLMIYGDYVYSASHITGVNYLLVVVPLILVMIWAIVREIKGGAHE